MIKNQIKKTLTVVIPAFNRGNLISRTLDSVAEQDATLFNLIIVDNNSTDETVAVVNEWMERNPEIHTQLLTESYQSAAAARNRGLENVGTEWVMFFDSDDVMLPGHISSAVSVAEENPGADIIGWDVTMSLSDGSIRVMRFPESSFLKNHLVHGSLSTQRYMVRTEFIRNVGGWNRLMTKWDDLELGTRLISAEPHIVHRVGEPLVKVIFSETSITGCDFTSGAGGWENALDVIENTLEKSRPEMTDWIAYRRAILAAEYSKEGSTELASNLLEKAKKRTKRPFIPVVIYRLKRVFPRGMWRIADLLIR